MDSQKRIVFFGFSEVGHQCLKYLLESGYNVVAVFTHDTDPHEEHWFKSPEILAKEYGIDVFKPKTLKTEKWFRKVRYMKPDLILSLYYRNFIPEEIFSCATLGAYNMHGSYLPAYRGRAPLNWAIINGENFCGETLHVMEKSFDTGCIVCQKKIEIGPEEYVGEILPRVASCALDVLKESMPAILSGNPKLTPQDETKASYYGKRTPEDGIIDFSKSAREVFNLIRAISRPFPGAFFDAEGRRAIIWRAHIGAPTDFEPGSIVSTDPLSLACSDRLIIADEVEYV